MSLFYNQNDISMKERHLMSLFPLCSNCVGRLHAAGQLPRFPAYPRAAGGVRPPGCLIPRVQHGGHFCKVAAVSAVSQRSRPGGEGCHVLHARIWWVQAVCSGFSKLSTKHLKSAFIKRVIFDRFDPSSIFQDFCDENNIFISRLARRFIIFFVIKGLSKLIYITLIY